MRVTWPQVLAWRVGRQFLRRDADPGVVDVVRRLGGVQAQVASAAEQAVAVRRPRTRSASPCGAGASDGLADGLADGSLVKTWAMRGTLHVLATDEAAEYLSLLAAARTWERGSWQRTFLDARRMAVLAEAAAEALSGGPLTREELTDAIVARTGDAPVADHLRSGWGAVLKPLAWQGLLCRGPARDGRVTFVRPDVAVAGWSGLPDAEDAAPLVVERYLGAYGPATAAAFDDWLLRGATPKPTLRRWFADLTAAGRLAPVDVDGETLHARAEDVAAIAATAPDDVLRLLPAFDQYVLGPGTKEAHVLAPARRSDVSRAAGWIAPVLLRGGRVVGTWEVAADALHVAIFEEDAPLGEEALVAEAGHLHPGLPVMLTDH